MRRSSFGGDDGMNTSRLEVSHKTRGQILTISIQDHFIPSTEVQNLLKQIFYTSKSLPDLFAALYLPVATLNIPDPETVTKPTGSKSNKMKKQKPKAKESSECAAAAAAATLRSS